MDFCPGNQLLRAGQKNCNPAKNNSPAKSDFNAYLWAAEKSALVTEKRTFSFFVFFECRSNGFERDLPSHSFRDSTGLKLLMNAQVVKLVFIPAEALQH